MAFNASISTARDVLSWGFGVAVGLGVGISVAFASCVDAEEADGRAAGVPWVDVGTVCWGVWGVVPDEEARRVAGEASARAVSFGIAELGVDLSVAGAAVGSVDSGFLSEPPQATAATSKISRKAKIPKESRGGKFQK